MPILSTCTVCGGKASSHCGKCRSECYCSQVCQKTHWSRHRAVCAHRATFVDALATARVSANGPPVTPSERQNYLQALHLVCHFGWLEGDPVTERQLVQLNHQLVRGTPQRSVGNLPVGTWESAKDPTSEVIVKPFTPSSPVLAPLDQPVGYRSTGSQVMWETGAGVAVSKEETSTWAMYRLQVRLSDELSTALGLNSTNAPMSPLRRLAFKKVHKLEPTADHLRLLNPALTEAEVTSAMATVDQVRFINQVLDKGDGRLRRVLKSVLDRVYYTPPLGQAMSTRMTNLVHTINRLLAKKCSKERARAVRIAHTATWEVALAFIHPFVHGNGRSARLLGNALRFQLHRDPRDLLVLHTPEIREEYDAAIVKCIRLSIPVNESDEEKYDGSPYAATLVTMLQ